MLNILTVKTISFITKGSILNLDRNSNNKFRLKTINYVKNAKKLGIYMSFEKNFMKESSAWIKTLTNSKKNAKNILIENLKRSGNGFLKTIQFPSNHEESYRFISFDKLFQMSFKSNTKTYKPKLYNELNISENEVWIFFINGIYCADSSLINILPADFFCGFFSDLSDDKQQDILDLANKGESGVNGGFFSALNTACLEDIIVLLIPENSVFKKNINIVFQGQGEKDNFYVNHKLVVINSKNSVSKIIQYHVGENNSKYFDNTTASIILHENSEMDYIFISQVPKLASQITSIHVEIEKNAHFRFYSAITGGFLSRLNIGIDVNGINSSAKLKGISISNSENIIDLHSRISHNYPECVSSQLHKNLVFDKGHAVFAGKIQVHSGSFNTESEQLCKTLLLSSTSKIDAMPILEINNDNVKCTHGATVSDLDKNEIFYFLSRGISIDIAKKILTRGFIKDLVDNFPKGFDLFFLSNIQFFK